MKRKLFLLFICPVFWEVACCPVNDPAGNVIEWSDFERVAKGKAVVTDIEAFSPPRAILSVDSLLLTANMQGERLVDIFNIHTGKLVKSAVVFGRGPGEMLSIQRIQARGDSLWLFDIMQRKLFETTLHDLLSEAPYRPTCYSGFSPVENAICLSNGMIVTDDFENALSCFSVYDRNGVLRGRYGTVPEPDQYGENRILALESAISTMAPLPDGSILVAYKRTDILELYDPHFVLKKRIQGPDRFSAAIRVVESGDGVRVKSSPEERDAYFHPVVLEKAKEIWLLYSGERWQSRKNAFLMNKVLVFDYQLNPLRRIDLDTPVASITVNENDRCMYGATLIEGELKIVCFHYE